MEEKSRKDWILEEKEFVPDHVRRYESLFCQGNGYLGVRASAEEPYEKTDRRLLIAGVFDRMERKNTSELAGAADPFAMEIVADGVRMSLNAGNYTGYRRTLNLQNGFLCRRFELDLNAGTDSGDTASVRPHKRSGDNGGDCTGNGKWETGHNRLQCEFERFVSMEDLHLLGQRARFCAAEGEVEMELISGIGGERRGEPHFLPGHGDVVLSAHQERPRHGGLLQYVETTRESRICVSVGASVRVTVADSARGSEGNDEAPVEVLHAKNGIFFRYHVSLKPGQELILEKLCRVATTRDQENSTRKSAADFGRGKECPKAGANVEGENLSEERWLEQERERVLALDGLSYDASAQASAARWDKLWQEQDVLIETRPCGGCSDQLAIRFAIYHMNIMAPLHDPRMGIGAKGLSGPGYLGHSFWDTEIYLLPFFIWTNPAGARSLLEYRFLGLDSARANARLHGFEGAMYPWESGWIADGEVCPDEAFSKYEQHVTADVAYGVVLYEEITGDRDFMRSCGCEILFETARFWSSRLEYCRETDRYEIRGVIGPDEFTHDADNNAFTNYMAHANLMEAVRWNERLKREDPGTWSRLNAKLNEKNLSGNERTGGRSLDEQTHVGPLDERTDNRFLDAWAADWEEKARRLYLPAPDENHILPQDDTWLTLPEIDLNPYRAGLRLLRQDYPYPSYTKLKVAKQADVTALLWLMGERFTPEVKKAGFDFYEPFCVHESSLSLSAYALLAADIGETDKAYGLFSRTKRIDLENETHSSDAGIHAASLGGIWQCCVLGFGGVRICGGRLRIVPHLPKQWEKMSFQVLWQGRRLTISVDHRQVRVQASEGETLEILAEDGTVRGNGTIIWRRSGRRQDGRRSM